MQTISRLAPRLAALRSVHTTSSASAVSMKQAAEAPSLRGVVPANDGYKRIQELQTIMTVSMNLERHDVWSAMMCGAPLCVEPQLRDMIETHPVNVVEWSLPLASICRLF